MNAHPQRRWRRASAGFTLLELLVGLTLFSLIVATLYSGLRLGARSWEVGEAKAAEVDQMRIAQGFLRRSLSRAYPLSVRKRRGSRVWFKGTHEKVAFVSELPAYIGDGGMHEITFAVEGAGDERKLAVYRRPLVFDAKGELTGKARKRVLVDDLEDARFRFFGAPDRKSVPAWHDDWEGLRRLPQLIGVEASSKSMGAWPELVVKLHIDGVRSLGSRVSRDAADEEVDEEVIEEEFEDDEPLDEEPEALESEQRRESG